MSEAPKFLPLGSAVTITDDDGTYVIIARGFQKQKEGFLAGYKTVRHPQGAAAGVREVVIRDTQIVKVVHRGYEDEKDAVFAKEQLEQAKTPPQKPAAAAPEPDLTVDLSAPPNVPAGAAPPTTATSAPAPVSQISDPKDPFKELRNKGKRA